MPPSHVRKKIVAREPVICAKACYQDPESVELMASTGFDAIWICLEHKRIDPAAVYAMIQACRLGGADALIRVKPSNYTDVLWLLESGARGIMLPRVRHPDEVRDIVPAMKFPPVGRRGCDAVHAEANFGRLPLPEYFTEANRENHLVVQIEDPEVIPHLDTIAAMPGVDVLFVGPGDLAIALGKVGATNDPEFQGILRAVAAACQRHGKVAGIPCDPDRVASYQSMGYGFFNVFSDYRGVFNGARQALAASRS
jgi:2-keto-3-deoxy-L-rhamnonate aldolase RhmA